MDCFLIQGPCRLDGSVTASGAKNAALPSLAACLLSEGHVELERVPAVRDVETMSRVLEHLGAEVEHPGTDAAPEAKGLRIWGGSVRADRDAPYDLVKTMRASVLVLGPLLARFGRARVSLPGGCAIGARPIDQHLAGFEALGAEIKLDQGYVQVTAKRLRGTRFQFAMPTVTGTENLLMAATLAEGTTVLQRCAREPEIQDLADLLRGMGARIEGDGTDTITVEGVDGLGSTQHRVLADRIEAGTYLLAGAITGGRVRVEEVRPDILEPLRQKLEQTGARWQTGENWIEVTAAEQSQPTDIVTAPHPGFATDLQAQFLAYLTQIDGRSSVVETVFENRFQHVPELQRMGAAIEISGNTAVIEGASKLGGAQVMATDLRASACLVLAGMVAAGETRVDRIYHLDRGYQQMESKLQNLGAVVERRDHREL